MQPGRAVGRSAEDGQPGDRRHRDERDLEDDLGRVHDRASDRRDEDDAQDHEERSRAASALTAARAMQALAAH